jgi:diaminohydroxyphosphoribosylaminopyrimidine deaminase/5-amino-6-(5-phosphoribosylamino)uracil reductase
MRARHDAVMIGAGTARADDPDLRVRGLGVTSQPVRIVCDSRLGLRPDSRLVASAQHDPVWVLHTTAAPSGALSDLTRLGVQAFLCACDDLGRIDIAAGLQRLGAKGLTRVFCEGGGGLASSLLRAGLVDDLVAISAGRVIGGDGMPGVAAMGGSGLPATPEFRLVAVRQLGTDVLHHWRRNG